MLAQKMVLQLRDGLLIELNSVLCSSLSFGVIHYTVVILLQFPSFSICHCSCVVMEHHCSGLRLFVSDLFITHPFNLLPPIPSLILLQFIKTRLRKGSSL